MQAVDTFSVVICKTMARANLKCNKKKRESRRASNLGEIPGMRFQPDAFPTRPGISDFLFFL